MRTKQIYPDKVCYICGCTFSPKTKNQKLCSKECNNIQYGKRMKLRRMDYEAVDSFVRSFSCREDYLCY